MVEELYSRRDKSGKPVIPLDEARTTDTGIIASFGGNLSLASAQVYTLNSGTAFYAWTLYATPLSGYTGSLQLTDAATAKTLPITVTSGPTQVFGLGGIEFLSSVFVTNLSGFAAAGVTSGLFAGAVQVIGQIDPKVFQE